MRDAPVKNQKRINWARDIILVLIVVGVGIGVAWKAGNSALRPKPKIAILSSTEDVYWDRLFQGGESAGKYFDAEVATIRCPADEAVQSQKRSAI